MKQRLKTSWKCSRRRGLTLIEVVAAITILGTLLVGIVLAKSRHTRQRADALSTVQAVQLSDALLSRWWSSRAGVPIGVGGVLSEAESLSWQTRLVEEPGISELGARVVRYEVFVDDGKQGLGRDRDDPLVVVDMVVPDPEVVAREAEETGVFDQEADEEAGDA